MIRKKLHPASSVMAVMVPLIFLLAVSFSVIPARVSAENARRINAGLLFSYTILDSEYFGMESAFGNDLTVRCELFGNIYYECRLGVYRSDSEGYGVTCFNGQTGAMVYATHFLPYRPYARAAFGLMSANPVTATPIDSYRPSQTTFYFVLGLGIARNVWKELMVEAGADVMFTPYEYIRYSFDRQSVLAEKSQFTHFNFSLGAAYSF